MCVTYLITFCCYGSRVPGEEDIVSRRNNLVGARCDVPNASFARTSRSTMANGVYTLDAAQRQVVLQAIIGVCQHRGWTLLATHVRTAHVHTVIAAETTPERVMNAFKSYASRALRCQRSWARHGSTVYLWTADAIANAVRYVVSKQGEPMAIFAG
jgi:REP element-mobilizing transposase RayT